MKDDQNLVDYIFEESYVYMIVEGSSPFLYIKKLQVLILMLFTQKSKDAKYIENEFIQILIHNNIKLSNK